MLTEAKSNQQTTATKIKKKKKEGSTWTNFIKAPLSTRSVHIEYNYKGRGDALDIATLEDTWWVYPVNPCCLTKFNFATEAIYDKVANETNNITNK